MTSFDNHGDRTAWLSIKLCAELGLDAPTSRAIAEAARTHDIGKQLVPTELLNKPGALTRDERAQMDRHCLLGAGLLSDRTDIGASQLSLSMDVALYHHEWWNGCGYPFGLSDTGIPLSARIVAVADVFEALCSVRPYKPAWPLERVLDYMRDRREVQFDPICLDALLDFIAALSTTWQDSLWQEAAADHGSPGWHLRPLRVRQPTLQIAGEPGLRNASNMSLQSCGGAR
ncbi:MAG: HD domain-containing phosphohydrolase [Burkholderiales bacterium]